MNAGQVKIDTSSVKETPKAAKVIWENITNEGGFLGRNAQNASHIINISSGLILYFFRSPLIQSFFWNTPQTRLELWIYFRMFRKKTRSYAGNPLQQKQSCYLRPEYWRHTVFNFCCNLSNFQCLDLWNISFHCCHSAALVTQLAFTSWALYRLFNRTPHALKVQSWKPFFTCLEDGQRTSRFYVFSHKR